MTSRTYGPMSAQRWNDVKAAFQNQAGVTLAGDSGSASSHGVNFGYTYTDSALTVTVTHVPWVYMMSESDVLDKFGQWIEEVQ